MESTSLKIFVTNISPFNKYLRIHGQANANIVQIIDSNISSFLKSPRIRDAVPNIDQLQIGKFCLALHGTRFVRARIVRIIPPLNKVIVHFLDLGFDRQIDTTNIRIGIFPKELEQLPVQACSYIVCGFMTDWQPHQLESITDKILYSHVEVIPQMELYDNHYAVFIWSNINLANYIIDELGFGTLINLEELRQFVFKVSKQKHSISKTTIGTTNHSIKGAAKNITPVRQPHTSNTATQGIGYQPEVYNNNNNNKPVLKGLSSFRSMIQGIQNENTRLPYTGNPMYNKNNNNSGGSGTRSTTIDSMPANKSAVSTFKSTTLLVGSTYDVACCYVDNGPCSFSIHLKEQEADLIQMMSQLEKIPLKNITEKPTLGMACIARYSQDNQFYRAIIMNIKLNVCQVSYIDYGNHEFVSYNDLYEIPINFLDDKCFSIRFALSGYKDLEPISETLKNIFKNMVLYRNFTLKVMPLEGPPLVQYCELYDENKQNILNIIKGLQYLKLSYQPNETLNKSDRVIVCYIESPKKFFVQKLNNQYKFETMMDELFFYCNRNRLKLTNFAIGSPCAVKFENAWYRAEIIDEVNNNRVSIRLVDFGNERECDTNILSEIAEKFTVDPPQAIQCCLKGYENMDSAVSENIINQFEMLSESSDGERRQFTANILKMYTSNCYLVNLIDETMTPTLNLMKRLFKLNMPLNKYIGMERENFKDVSGLEVRDKSPLILSQKQHSEIGNYGNNFNNNQDDNRMNNMWEKSSSGSSENYNMKKKRRSSPVDAIYDNQQQNRPNRNMKYENENIYENKTRSSNNNNNYKKIHNNSSETSGTYSQSPNNSFNNKDNYDNNLLTTVPVTKPDLHKEEYMPMDYEIPKIKLNVPSNAEVIICWWISPNQFYTHLNSRTVEFKRMMKEIQIFYENKEPIQELINIGTTIIARYKADKILYRAKILACNNVLRKYKVEFIDFGNQSTISQTEAWQLEKRFANEPIMCYQCGLDSVISMFPSDYIIKELEKYLTPDSSVLCNYLRIDDNNNKMIVDIELKNGKKLKDLLLENGLISELPQEVKLEVLLGQQIKGKIVNVQDLLCFYVVIEGCEINLLCSYHDIKYIKNNSQLSSKFKEIYEGEICTFEIIDVNNDKMLMVLPIIDLFTTNLPPPICNLPIISDIVVAKLTYVSNFNKLYFVPIYMENELNNLLNDMFTYYDVEGTVLKSLQIGGLCAANSADGNWYRAQIISTTASQAPSSGNLNNSIEILYIDYGNTEIIDDKNKLKKLEDIYLKSASILAMEIYFPIKSIANTTDDHENIIEKINSLATGYELNIKLLDNYENCWIADILNDNFSLIDVLANENLIERTPAMQYTRELILQNNKRKLTYKLLTEEFEIDANNEETNNENSIKESVEHKTTNVITNNNIWKDCSKAIANHVIKTSSNQNINNSVIDDGMFEGYISHCDNPGRFFLQLTSERFDFQKLQDNIQIVANSLPPLMTFITGASCIALYSVDNIWYRAKIVDSELMAVQFTDYGNTDVDIDPERIREMNEAFDYMKPYAIPCALPIVPIKNDWDDTANEIFLKSLENVVHFEIICSTQNAETEINYINLLIDNINVADYLCEQKLAKKLKCIKSGESVYISHVNNLSDFYIEYETDGQGLALMAEHLSNFNQFPIISKTNSGENDGLICAAVFPEDNEWYRAKILNCNTERFEVLFIDFGNTSVTNEARELSNEISKIPPLAHKCCLKKPENMLEWSSSAELIFLELSAGGENKFIIEMNQPTVDYSIVELFIDDKNIMNIIEPSYETGKNFGGKIMNMSTSTEIAELQSFVKMVSISHINSPQDFYVQNESDFTVLEEMTLSLLVKLDEDNQLVDPKCDDICAAVFQDDGALYRAKILSIESDGSYNVLFIDFGNCSISNDIRQLPDELLKIPPLAKQCSISMPNYDLNSIYAIDAFKEATRPMADNSISMTILNDHEIPAIVQLHYLDVDVNEIFLKTFKLTKNFWQDILPTSMENVTISHVTSTDEFYVQLESDIEKVKEINLDLNNNQVKLMKITEPLKCGDLCVALFPDDNYYYRAQILNINEETAEATVLFIDFGNIAKTNDLCIIPNDLYNYKAMAIKCSLQHNLNEKYSKNVINRNFIEFIDSHFGEVFQILNIQIIPHPDDLEYLSVQLYKHNSDIITELEKLIEQNTIIDDNNAIIDNVKKCSISHYNSPNDFYIQFAKDSTELVEISQQLANANLNFKKYEILPECNELCAAKFQDDGAFYRAKILSKTENDCMVQYIDFGNVEISNDLRQLPNELKLIPGYGIHCSLENPFEISFTNPDAIECFQNLMDTHLNETFQIDILNDSNDPFIVKLYFQDRNLAEELSFKIQELTLRADDDSNDGMADQTSNWDTLKETSLTTSAADDIAIVDDIINDITNNSTNAANDIYSIKNISIDENIVVNSTTELAAELYKDYKATSSHPNVIRK